MNNSTNGSVAHKNPRTAETFGPAKRVRKNLAGLTHDVISLAELQSKLLSADLSTFLQHSKFAALLVGIAAVLLLSSFPVLLFAAGWALASSTELSLASALLLTAVAGGLIPSACLAWFGIRRVRQNSSLLHRSRTEFSRNVTWLKATMQTHSGR